MKIEPRYVVLGSLGIAFALLGYLWEELWIVKNLAPNMAAGFITTLLTVFFIDRANEKRLNAGRSRVNNIALREMAAPIVSLVDLFGDLIKASMKERPSPLPSNLRELFSPEYTQNLDWLDMTQYSDPHLKIKWCHQVAQRITQNLEKLSHIIDTYISVIDIELIERLAAVRDDEFFDGVRYCAVVLAQGPEPEPMALQHAQRQIKAYES